MEDRNETTHVCPGRRAPFSQQAPLAKSPAPRKLSVSFGKAALLALKTIESDGEKATAKEIHGGERGAAARAGDRGSAANGARSSGQAAQGAEAQKQTNSGRTSLIPGAGSNRT